MTEIVLAEKEWTDNAALIADVAQLGYIEGRVLDLTYGRGNFWTDWKPEELVGNDITLGAAEYSHDFCRTAFETDEFKTVVFDPDYKLSGTPALGDFDDRYGIDIPKTRRERMASICAGTVEACRLSSCWVLVKCMDQVNGGKVRWQTDIVTQLAWAMEFGKVDSFHVRGGMPQPKGRSQDHARRYFSTLLVFKRQPR